MMDRIIVCEYYSFVMSFTITEPFIAVYRQNGYLLTMQVSSLTNRKN